MIGWLLRRRANDQLAVKRSGAWPRVSAEFMKEHPTCEWCGRPANVVHHIKPVSYYPELELDKENMQSTCGEDGPCHLWGGHCGSWKSWNPFARQDAAICLKRVQDRQTGRRESQPPKDQV